MKKAFYDLAKLPNKTPAQREQLQRLLLRLFDHRQQAEQNTATARARTAKQFSRFLQPDRVSLFPNLRWLPSRSANPRTTHWAFYNHVWPKNDSFWDNNSPGTEWNCKCDIEETDEPLTDNQGFGVKTPPAGLEGKPWETGELFTDNASYVVKTRSMEKECQKVERRSLQAEAETHPATKQTFSCEIENEEREIHVADWGVKEIAQSMFGTKQFWLKNEMLNHLHLFNGATLFDDGIVDLSHNSGKTLRLKKKFRHFFYLRKTLPDGEDVFLNVVQHENGNYYLYTITKKCPNYE